MQVLIKLLLNGFQHVRMPMAHIAHPNARDQIEQFFAVGALHIPAFRFFNFQQQRKIRSLGLVFEEKLAGGKHFLVISD